MKMIAAAVVLVVLAGCGDSGSKKVGSAPSTTTTTATTEAPTTTTTEAPTTTTTTKTRFAVGEPAQAGMWVVTVHAVHDPQPAGQYDRPDAGNRYVGLDVDVKNAGGKSDRFSTLAQLELRDSENQVFKATFTTVKPESPEGEVEPGGARRGIAVFEIPAAAHGLSLRVEGDFLGGDVVVVDLGR
jgi:hypothetical protein